MPMKGIAAGALNVDEFFIYFFPTPSNVSTGTRGSKTVDSFLEFLSIGEKKLLRTFSVTWFSSSDVVLVFGRVYERSQVSIFRGQFSRAANYDPRSLSRFDKTINP